MIVVTGATGNIGRSLVGQLLAEGAPVRALTRDPARAGLPAEAETVRADLTDPASLEPALHGAEALFLNLAAGGGEAAASVVGAAVKAGARRIVLNSSIAVTDAPEDNDNFLARMHGSVESAVRASGLEWTFVRGGAYATNALQWAQEIRESGVVRDPHPGSATAPVHEDDLAAVAAAALLDRTGAHTGKAYVVTGPASLTREDQVAVIGRAVGRPARVEVVSEEQAAEERATPSVSKETLLQLFRLFASSVGTTAPVTDTVQQVTGRPARTFEQWARDHAGDFS
ncbi:nucleoside-diphosphate sugar epimerase [Streptomyces sp. CB02923]|uniref:NAD(P)H-binding protein n=1 Tax=Streptomyces sp. CB02923 TaxID=1718985 RepID=UPI00093E740C|nr:NAD(P)H-binding protein [Streptomyces sp. CB02923]OKI10124.1 nucleoside-diphosphate sugar epimerase [Streptomyces sp. CB02923]